LRKKVEREPGLAAELHFASLPDVEHLCAQYLCSVESLKDFLRGAPVNRDGNLYAQFAGGARRSKWNHPELLEMMWSLRKWDPDKFIISEEHRAEFYSSIERQRAAMNGYFESMRRQYRQHIIDSRKAAYHQSR